MYCGQNDHKIINFQKLGSGYFEAQNKSFTSKHKLSTQRKRAKEKGLSLKCNTFLWPGGMKWNAKRKFFEIPRGWYYRSGFANDFVLQYCAIRRNIQSKYILCRLTINSKLAQFSATQQHNSYDLKEMPLKSARVSTTTMIITTTTTITHEIFTFLSKIENGNDRITRIHTTVWVLLHWVDRQFDNILIIFQKLFNPTALFTLLHFINNVESLWC